MRLSAVVRHIEASYAVGHSLCRRPHSIGYLSEREVCNQMQQNYQSGEACCFTGRNPGMDPTMESNVVMAGMYMWNMI